MSASTQFFSNPLSKLLIVVANSCDPDNQSLSPQDIRNIPSFSPSSASRAANPTNDRADVIALARRVPPFSPTCWNVHIPSPLVEGTDECSRLTQFVRDFIQSDPTHGVLVCTSARHFRFYEKWSYQFNSCVLLAPGVVDAKNEDESNNNNNNKRVANVLNNNVHVLNTGQTTSEQQEPFLRSVQRALRVVSTELPPHRHKKISLQLICACHVDEVCCGRNPERNISPLCQEHEQEEEQVRDENDDDDRSKVEENNQNSNNSNKRNNNRQKQNSPNIVIKSDDIETGDLVGISFMGSALCEQVIQVASDAKPWRSFECLEVSCTSSIDMVETIGVHLRQHKRNSSSDTGDNMNEGDDTSNNAPAPDVATALFFVGRSYARVGLMGNPSDQLHGKSMAVTVKNFWSTVTVTPNTSAEGRKITFVPHPVADDTTERYSGIGAVARQVSRDGYSGGIRLLQATCKRLFEYTVKILSTATDNSSGKNDRIDNNNENSNHNISNSSLSNEHQEQQREQQVRAARKVLEMMEGTGFRIQYDTNVPRQVGLAGSSCIASAALKALLQFYGVHDCPYFLPLAQRPTFVLDVEAKELNINAGLMDRVAQVFEGLIEMDFTNPAETERNGHAVYKRHPVSCLPTLLLAIALDPSDSGKIHATVRQRFADRDPEVLDAVKEWVRLVDESVAAITQMQAGTISKQESDSRIRALMDQNFDLRRKLYGDRCLGWKNLKMVEIARKHKAAAKFPGSGGAVLISAHPTETNVDALAAELETNGFSLVSLELFEP